MPPNYRPISLLSVLLKVLERIVQGVYNHVDPVLPVGQSGFRKTDGTVLQLTRIVDRLAEALDNKDVIASCYSDSSKAFDRAWHVGLLSKLALFGIGDPALLNWF